MGISQELPGHQDPLGEAPPLPAVHHVLAMGLTVWWPVLAGRAGPERWS